jgi:eukaryotic-like serine/threonine-protein kinase
VKDPLLGRTIAHRYRLISQLGSGRFASVYLARHVLIERLSAIKIVHPELAGDPVARDRFLREARAVNRINHPSIVEIDDYGDADGLVYLVMEYVPGEPLTTSLGRGPLGWRRAANIGLQIASALGRAHEMGVIHRDLRPANILVVQRRDGDERIKLTDFGGAKLLDASPNSTRPVRLGTPGYSAPEYRYNGRTDALTDLFSLGVVLYEATAGVLPYGDDPSPRALPPSPLGAFVNEVPPYFEDVVATLTAIDPDDRPRDGFEAEEMLRRVLEREGAAAWSVPGSSPRPRALSSRPKPAPLHADAPPADLLLDPGAPPSPRRSRSGSHLTTTAPFHRLPEICVSALGRLETEVRARSPLSSEAALKLDEARRLVGMVESIGELVLVDSRSMEASNQQARAIRGGLGRRIDELARARSKTLGWAGTLAERTYDVQARRSSGEHPIPAIEAMIWEQAALEQEEDKVREKAAELTAKLTDLENELALRSEQLDATLAVENARMEGRASALRSLALEAWLALEETAGLSGVGRAVLSIPPAVPGPPR